MGWVTLSLRKMVLTQRVSQLEQRLWKLSQEQQSLDNSSSYSERAIGLRKNEAYTDLYNTYSQDSTTLASQYSGTNGTEDLTNYLTAIQESQLTYMYNKMMIDSVFTQEEEALQDQVNNKQTYLELEQEQVETQLESARAELEQMDEAISKDIETSTISLV